MFSTKTEVGVNFVSHVQEQLDYLHHETSYIVGGGLGRLAVMGLEPEYWVRPNGVIRDIDVFDTDGTNSKAKDSPVNNQPLLLDDFCGKWIDLEGERARIVFPFDPRINVAIPDEHLEPVPAKLLGQQIRTFRTEVLYGLDATWPFDRRRQRATIAAFRLWAEAQPSFDSHILEPYQDFASDLKRAHPEFIRKLQMRDLAKELIPRPVYRIAQSAYRAMQPKLD